MSDAHLFIGIALAFVYYSFLISGGDFDLFHGADRNLVSGVVYNSMLLHLLQGDFSVDPEAIRFEAFDKDGKTYAYFGVAPVLLRLPFLPLDNFATIDITPLSIVIATCVSAYFKCASLLLIRRLGEESPMQTALFGLLVLSVLVGGAQIQFLEASVYQEAICWAMALCSAFIYCAMRGLFLPSRFSVGLLATLAGLAGLALLTRVTAGIGLYAALGLLLGSLGAQACFLTDGRDGAKRLSTLQWLMTRQVILPLLILSLFAVICGIVNYGRWGNPFVFADIHLNRLMVGSRIAVIDNYGEFNIWRLPYSFLYYFFPINYIAGPDGAFLFADFRQRYYDGVEPPLSSFLLSDPATLLLAASFFLALVRGDVPAALDRRHTTALLAGFSAPVILILTYYFLSFRFRGEFYPLLEFAAMLGFYVMGRSSSAMSQKEQGQFERRVRHYAIMGIFTSHLLLVIYQTGPSGS